MTRVAAYEAVEKGNELKTKRHFAPQVHGHVAIGFVRFAAGVSLERGGGEGEAGREDV